MECDFSFLLLNASSASSCLMCVVAGGESELALLLLNTILHHLLPDLQTQVVVEDVMLLVFQFRPRELVVATLTR